MSRPHLRLLVLAAAPVTAVILFLHATGDHGGSLTPLPQSATPANGGRHESRSLDSTPSALIPVPTASPPGSRMPGSDVSPDALRELMRQLNSDTAQVAGKEKRLLDELSAALRDRLEHILDQQRR